MSDNTTAVQAPAKTGFTTDADGKPSVMRVMSMISLFASIYFGAITINMAEPNQMGVYITSMFLLGAFAPKALQKFIENAYPSSKLNS